MQKYQNILSVIPNHCGPLRNTKTSKFFSHNFSQCNSEKLIRTLHYRLAGVVSKSSTPVY